ncbi:HtaR suppressor protein [uncultured Candidatus Thioglobus sp.]|nr:HtaR suppressor protein [uncultured Candidatus Thioglobus sp.]
MSQAIVTSESTLTDRYQTTVPEVVRKALHLHKRDKVRYVVGSDGDVKISKLEQFETDPVLENFLHFLANDINNNPENLKLVDENLVDEIGSLVKGVKIDL